MNQPQKEIIGIFPTPISISHFDCGQEIKNFFNSVKMRSDQSEIHEMNFGGSSEDYYLLSKNEICKPLTDFILQESLFFCKEVFAFDIEGVRITQSWITHKNPKQTHNHHRHANSLISGTFYFDDQFDTYDVEFVKPRGSGGMWTMSVPTDPKKAEQSQLAWESVTFNMRPNSLILFPSYLEHGVPQNQTDKTRKSLAFNIMPTYKIGSYDALSEFVY
jgi:uncharacterized protein (TIGR02466 family)